VWLFINRDPDGDEPTAPESGGPAHAQGAPVEAVEDDDDDDEN
jgi:hypothetical protein